MRFNSGRDREPTGKVRLGLKAAESEKLSAAYYGSGDLHPINGLFEATLMDRTYHRISKQDQ
jgi:hypothetical protein